MESSPSEPSNKPKKKGGKNEITILPNLYFQSQHSKKQKRASLFEKIVFESVYLQERYPSKYLQILLATLLDMDTRKVQIWFQNRRTKEKKSNTLHEIHNLIDTEHIHSKNSEGNTLLLVFCCIGNLSLVLYLLQQGANPNVSNNKGWTPILVSILFNNYDIFQMLLSRGDIDINCQEKDYGQSCLHLVVLKGEEFIVDILLKYANINVNIMDNRTYTPLHHACICGHLSIAKKLLNAKANIEAQSIQHHTPLHNAAISGNEKSVQLLLVRGADPLLLDRNGFTALHFAIQKGRFSTVKLLLENKKNHLLLHMKTESGYTPLLLACCYPNIEIVKLLLSLTKCQDKTKGGRSALHLAVINGHISIVKLLLERNYDILGHDSFDYSPLDYAEKYQFIDIKKILNDHLLRSHLKHPGK